MSHADLFARRQALRHCRCEDRAFEREMIDTIAAALTHGVVAPRDAALLLLRLDDFVALTERLAQTPLLVAAE